MMTRKLAVDVFLGTKEEMICITIHSLYANNHLIGSRDFHEPCWIQLADVDQSEVFPLFLCSTSKGKSSLIMYTLH